MTRRPPRSTRTDTLFPYTTLFRSPATRASLRAAIGDTPPSGVARDPQAAGFRLQSLHWTTKKAAAQYRTSTGRSEEHTSELQSLMRISYAVFCLKKKKKEKSHVYTLTH